MTLSNRFVAAGWLTYSAYYIGRVTLAAAKPILASDGYSYAVLSWFDFAFLWTYALGQLISGRLADVFPGRTLIVAGLVGSALACAGFSMVGIGAAGLALWAFHGFVQSLGWSPLLRGARHSVASRNLPLAMCFIATAYQAGSALGHGAAGIAIREFSWRGPFLLPLLIYPPILALCFKSLGTEPAPAIASGPARVAFKVPEAFWLLSGTLILTNVLRYGLLLWLPALLVGAGGISVQRSGSWSAAIVAASIAATMACGVFLRSSAPPRVAGFAAGLLAVVGLLCCALLSSPGESGRVLPVLLLICSCLHAAHAIVVAIVPAMLSPAARAGTAAGTMDAIGYLGTGAAGVVTGYFARAGAWSVVLLLWAAVAVFGAVFALWANYRLRTADLKAKTLGVAARTAV